jgi:hypothetical protein
LEAREKIVRGATALADDVPVTPGPKSKCVLIEKKRGKPLLCDDGGNLEVLFKPPESVAYSVTAPKLGLVLVLEFVLE